MPIEQTTRVTAPEPAATLGPRNHRITYMDLQGTSHELRTQGSVLVMDPALALRCEMAGLEYTYINPHGVLWISVEVMPTPTPPPDPSTLEVREAPILEPLPNGIHEGGD